MANTHASGSGVQPKAQAEAPGSSREKAGATGAARDGRERVQRVLDRFARAITAGDGEAAADVWQTPAFVIGAGMVRPVASREEVAAFFGSGKEQYNARGITQTRAEIERLDWVSDDLVVADVRWPYLTAEGEEVGEERSSYTLLRGADGELQIRVALMRGASQ